MMRRTQASSAHPRTATVYGSGATTQAEIDSGLFVAASTGQPEDVIRWLDRGANSAELHPAAFKGAMVIMSPLHVATLRGRVANALALIDSGFDIDMPARNGLSACHMAALSFNSTMAKTLYALGASPFSRPDLNSVTDDAAPAEPCPRSVLVPFMDIGGLSRLQVAAISIDPGVLVRAIDRDRIIEGHEGMESRVQGALDSLGAHSKSPVLSANEHLLRSWLAAREALRVLDELPSRVRPGFAP